MDRLRSVKSQFKTVNEYAEEMEEIYREVHSQRGQGDITEVSRQTVWRA